KELCEELQSLLARSSGAQPDTEVNPFAGLLSFQEADAARYFGRENEVASITRQLRDQPLVAVGGASGGRESSFVRAGVIPALKRSGERWEVFVVRPGNRPLAALAALVDTLAQSPASPRESLRDSWVTGEIEDVLRARPGTLGALLRARCRR